MELFVRVTKLGAERPNEQVGVPLAEAAMGFAARSIGRPLFRVWYHIVDLLICCAKVALVGALVAAVAPAVFVLSAQLFRWWGTGEWHPVSGSELLRIFGFEAPPSAPEFARPLVELLLTFPATLVLFLIVLVLLWVVRQLGKVERYQLRALQRSQQKEMIGAIEQALADTKG